MFFLSFLLQKFCFAAIECIIFYLEWMRIKVDVENCEKFEIISENWMNDRIPKNKPSDKKIIIVA